MKRRLATLVLILLAAVLVAQPTTTRLSADGVRVQAANGGNNFWLNWTPAVDISQSPTDEASWPTMQVTDDGETVYVAWSDGRDVAQDIYYARSTDGGESWVSATVFTSTHDNSLRPSMALEGDIPVVAWADEAGPLEHTTYQMALTDASALIVPNPNVRLASAPRLVASGGGDLHLALQGASGSNNPDILYTRRKAGEAAWPEATIVVEHEASGAKNPALAVDADGTVHLVWQEDFLSASSVRYVAGQPSGGAISWGTPVTLSLGITTAIRPAISLGPDDTVYVAWGEKAPDVKTQYVRLARSDDGGAHWSVSWHIVPDPVSANSIAPTDVAPALAVMPSGTVCVAWHGIRDPDAIQAEEILVTCSTDRGATFGSVVNVSRSTETISIRPVLAAGGDGTLHVAWQEYSKKDVRNTYQIYYAHTVPCVVHLPIITRSFQ